MSSIDLSTTLNHQVRLAARPVGLPTDADWQLTPNRSRHPTPAAWWSRRWRCRWTRRCAAG
jgi:hypothetical protein